MLQVLQILHLKCHKLNRTTNLPVLLFVVATVHQQPTFLILLSPSSNIFNLGQHSKFSILEILLDTKYSLSKLLKKGHSPSFSVHSKLQFSAGGFKN